MITYQRWSPDVCECQLIEEIDTVAGTRKILLEPIVVKNDRGQDVFLETRLCDHHRGHTPDKEETSPQLDECRRKNYTFGEAQKLKPDLTLDDYTWSFTKAVGGVRQLKVGFLGKLNASHGANLQATLNARFGAGKVEVL